MLDKFHWFTTCQSAFCYYESLLKARLKVKQKLSSKAEILSEEALLLLKIIYSEKATKFGEISTNYLSYVLPVK